MVGPKPLIFALGLSCAMAPPLDVTASEPEGQLLDLIRGAQPYALVPDALFAQLGWDLPDGGEQVRNLAEESERWAFDPADLARLDSARLGYRARWRVHRFAYYGLEWDITGLHLLPVEPEPGLPTVAFINGGAANWYEFFVDPLNAPGLGQYLAQRIPVLLITIPGNYKPGGWSEPIPERAPRYLLDRDLDEAEAGARNAVFTFTLISEGVAQLIEQTVEGTVLISGHSTGGEIQYMLRDRLRSRLVGRSLGWGTGGPAHVRRRWDQEQGGTPRDYPPVSRIRYRNAQNYANGAYIGPLNPVKGADKMAVAEGWFERVSGRRPQFKQVIQDIEHRGEDQRRAAMIEELARAVAAAGLEINTDQVAGDYFSTMRVELTGYRRMLWSAGALDRGHWSADPERAREVMVAAAFREANPAAEIRVIGFETLMTHYGHIERPRQLAGACLVGVRWLMEE